MEVEKIAVGLVRMDIHHNSRKNLAAYFECISFPLFIKIMHFDDHLSKKLLVLLKKLAST
jgi:hypothetical protein